MRSAQRQVELLSLQPGTSIILKPVFFVIGPTGSPSCHVAVCKMLCVCRLSSGRVGLRIKISRCHGLNLQMN